MLEALHRDEGKLRWDLSPWRAFKGVIEVVTYGCKKYAERNWEKGMKYSRLFASAQRHMIQWWLREDNDPESGLLHLKHALTNLAMLVDYIERGMNEFDDRPTTTIERSGFDSDERVSPQSGDGSGKDKDVAFQCAHRGMRWINHASGQRLYICDDCRQPIP